MLYAGYGPWRPYMAKVLTNSRMTAPTHFQDSRHIELDLGNSGLSYESGHLLAVFPQQPAAAVEDFLQRLGLDADVWVKIEPEGQSDASQSPAIEVCYSWQVPMTCAQRSTCSVDKGSAKLSRVHVHTALVTHRGGGWRVVGSVEASAAACLGFEVMDPC
jgi:hypothetical protein